MKIALGPILYFWPRETVLEFYRQVKEWPVDIVYLGEVVCSKRRLLRTDDWLSIAEELAAAGKEVVLSTLALIEADSEIKTLKRLVENGKVSVEANDMAAVHMLAGKVDYVAGPHLNIYNAASLALHNNLGAKRWVVPVELSRSTIIDLLEQRPEALEAEIFSFGRIPLAFSARCFTARAAGLPKDDCQYLCGDDPDGLAMQTQEGETFLAINGVQTQSASVCNLIGALPQMKHLGIDVIRLSPQSQRMDGVVSAFADVLSGVMSAEDGVREIDRLTPFNTCNGYWFGEAGMAWCQADAAGAFPDLVN